MSFVHLHVHTEYSLLDGACRIRELPQVVKDLGQEACAVTDHGVMYGVIDFYRACREAGIKPIIGCEVYVAPKGRTRFQKVHEFDSESRHMVLLCENEEGYRNLSYMVSMAWTEGFYIKPRIDMDLLREHSRGLICLSACIAGEIPRMLRNGEYENAKAYALELSELFGPDRFYLEVQDHGIPAQREVNQGLLRLHQDTGLPLVCTNDAHYLRPQDTDAHDILLCIQTGKTLDEPNRLRYEPRQFYLRSEAEMRERFAAFPDAVENTAKIAEMCSLDFHFGTYHLPEFQLPPGYDSFTYLKELCDAGYKKRYGDDDSHREQLAYEENMIEKMGFTDYFLIVSDFVRYAKGEGIPVGPGRGSAAGSMVSYCLEITDVDPVKYSLYFERFLNPERVSMPDIDMDFGDTRRGEVVEYVRRKYGEDRVAQIVTFGTMAARGVLRDVGRVMNLPYAEVDTIAKLVPFGPHITLDDALRLSKQLSDMYNGDERIRRLIDTAKSLEGMPRNASTHAAGVVITKKPVYEYVPLSSNDGTVVCQYVMTTLEELGLLKMDFLGLRNLTVLDDAVKMVQRKDPAFRLDAIPEDDKATFDMISAGKTSGVFQIESAGMTGVCVGLKPRSIEDITAVIALYRPGPMDSIPKFIACSQDPKLVTYRHPSLEPILSVTYGCIVYQEQVIQIFQKLGGYSLGQADMVRRAISKKKASQIQKEKDAFIHGDPSRNIAGCVANGIPEQTAEAIYQEIYDFANYAFNKAHAVSYAVVAYQTAYFKRHYPREYMAALLTSVLDNPEKVAGYIAECRELGIALLPPDINASTDRFSVEAGGIRFGLAAIKNIGQGFVQAVVREREERGPFASLPDFCARVKSTDMNKRAVENLIRAGAFDSTGAKRSQLLQIYDRVMDGEAARQKKNLEGQMDFFGLSGDGGTDGGSDTDGTDSGSGAGTSRGQEIPLPNVPEFSPQELMAMEKETTGLYLSGHPMDAWRETVTALHIPPMAAVLQDFAREDGPARFRDGQQIQLAGVVTANRTRTTKNNTLMAYVTLEDDSASMELLCFARCLEKSGVYLKEGEAIVAAGRLSVRDEKPPQLMCDGAWLLSTVAQNTGTAPGQPGFAGGYDGPGGYAGGYSDGYGGPDGYGGYGGGYGNSGRNNPAVQDGTLYLKLPSAESPEARHIRLLLAMFPGPSMAKIVMADTRQVIRERVAIYDALLQEARETLGGENVVVK